MTLIAALVLTTTLNLPGGVSTLVLRSGHQIAVDGPIREDNGRIVFHGADGMLYSLPATDIDVVKTRHAGVPVAAAPQVDNEPRLKLRVSEAERQRLLRQLEQNHSGQPAPESFILSHPPQPMSPAEEQQMVQDEWTWRLRARSYEEGVRHARENLELLVRRVTELRSRISGFFSLGYRPDQYSYDTAVLQTTLEQIPYAELEVTRAERAYDDFKEDARRMGVMPGWLR
jgi:hypothetical protein